MVIPLNFEHARHTSLRKSSSNLVCTPGLSQARPSFQAVGDAPFGPVVWNKVLIFACSSHLRCECNTRTMVNIRTYIIQRPIVNSDFANLRAQPLKNRYNTHNTNSVTNLSIPAVNSMSVILRTPDDQRHIGQSIGDVGCIIRDHSHCRLCAIEVKLRMGALRVPH